jgi:hypothetical protein
VLKFVAKKAKKASLSLVCQRTKSFVFLSLSLSFFSLFSVFLFLSFSFYLSLPVFLFLLIGCFGDPLSAASGQFLSGPFS